VLLLASCHRGPTEFELRRTFDAANLAFLRGELTDAQAVAERGLAQAGPQADSEWSWRFRMLRGDILISERNLSEVRALVHATLPPTVSDSLRAKQTFLEARVMLVDRRLDDALRLAKRVGEIAPRDRQLRGAGTKARRC
jgi:outer membrane PBP1 activator LpoA protein